MTAPNTRDDLPNMSNEHRRRPTSTARQAVATVLLSGLMAAIAALGGSWIGSHGALAVQREQAQEARRTEARTKRTAVYESFLTAANAFAVPSVRAAEKCVEGPCNFADWQGIAGDQSEALMNAYDQVALYGSFRGFIAAGRLVDTFPMLLLFKREVARRTSGDFSTEFEAAYQTFARVVCEEVNAEPRSNCSKLLLPAPPTLSLAKRATEVREHLPGGVITIYR
jgi:hypothetical protein